MQVWSGIEVTQLKIKSLVTLENLMIKGGSKSTWTEKSANLFIGQFDSQGCIPIAYNNFMSYTIKAPVLAKKHKYWPQKENRLKDLSVTINS